MEFSQAFRETMFRFELKGVDIASSAGVKQGQITALKKGDNITLQTFEKIVRALPDDARHYFLHLVDESQRCA